MNATTKAMHIGRGKLPVEAVVMQTAIADANREANNQTIASQNEVITKSELPPVAPVHLSPSRLYSVEDIAKIVGLSNSWVYAQVSNMKPLVRGKDGHKLLYGFDFVSTLLGRQQTKLSRVSEEEHVEAHGSVIDRLIAIEHHLANAGAVEQKIQELTIEIGRLKAVLGV